MGSEMCIRDRANGDRLVACRRSGPQPPHGPDDGLCGLVRVPGRQGCELSPRPGLVVQDLRLPWRGENIEQADRHGIDTVPPPQGRRVHPVEQGPFSGFVGVIEARGHEARLSFPVIWKKSEQPDPQSLSAKCGHAPTASMLPLCSGGARLSDERTGCPQDLHIDMDALYASVGQRDDRALRGRRVAVGCAAKRGVVADAEEERQV